MIRDIEPQDYDRILELNSNALDAVGPLDYEGLALLVKLSDQALVLDEEGDVAGFVITLPPDVPYDSSRYRWFAEHLADDYVYLDRVIVSPEHRRRGVASTLYSAVEADRPIALEVYSTNDASLAFHRSRGFAPVGELVENDVTNVMMVRPVA